MLKGSFYQDRLGTNIEKTQTTVFSQVSSVLLRIGATNVVSADVLSITHNGQSLDTEHSSRSQLGDHVPYNGQWIDVELRGVRPVVGENTLEFAIVRRPARLATSVTLQYVELKVHYNIFPSTTSARL